MGLRFSGLGGLGPADSVWAGLGLGGARPGRGSAWAGSAWAAATATRTKAATAAERLVSGQATMTWLGLRSRTGTTTRPTERNWAAAETGT